MTIRPLFPTPVASFNNFITSKERLHLIKSIKNTPHYSHEALVGEGLSTWGKSSNFLDRNIKKRIQTAVDEYNKECGNHPSTVDNIWSNIQNAGSRLAEHTHPLSTVSGALYINVDDSCKLYFHYPNPYVVHMDRDRPTPYNFEFQWIDVQNSQLIIFPSWLKHGKYSEVNTMNDRIVVSFNSR